MCFRLWLVSLLLCVWFAASAQFSEPPCTITSHTQREELLGQFHNDAPWAPDQTVHTVEGGVLRGCWPGERLHMLSKDKAVV